MTPRDTIDQATATAMYRLYESCYADTDAARFRADLDAKTHVLLLTDDVDELCGFSTLQIYTTHAAGTEQKIIYSGDTIIEPRYWGSSTLAFEWLRFVGDVSRQDGDLPLYWLLIVKGHRTYRFLSTFARRYVPHHKFPISSAERDQLNALATEKFGSDFDESSGIVRFSSPRGRLNGELADVPERHRRMPAVDYFLKRNPGYRNGDELVCVCELSTSNLKPLALRVFAPST